MSETMFQRRRRGLSPLLAIIIGLIIVIVAGILLSQLYFSYAATISTRQSCNIEYVDLIAEQDGSGTLVINVKNVGNVRIIKLWLIGSGIRTCHRYPYTTAYGGNTNIPPGSTGSIVCYLRPGTISKGLSYSAVLEITFEDNSVQKLNVIAKAR